jgi:iron complex outermembrane receptor protein
LDENQTLRLSFSSAIRNPTLADQYLYYNVGRAVLKGNLNGFDSLVTLDNIVDYLGKAASDRLAHDFGYFNVDAIRPEKVKTLEGGYRATLFERVFVDANYYYSLYDDFIGYIIGADIEEGTTAIDRLEIITSVSYSGQCHRTGDHTRFFDRIEYIHRRLPVAFWELQLE